MPAPIPSTHARRRGRSTAGNTTSSTPAHVYDRATTIGIELEFLTLDADGGRLALEQAERIVADLEPLPAGSRLTIEPGGQLEISTATYTSVDDACAAAADDLFVLDQRCMAERSRARGVGRRPRAHAGTSGDCAEVSRHAGVLRQSGQCGAHHDVQHRRAPGERVSGRCPHGRPWRLAHASGPP